ncbi:head-tail adaptor protein [Pantoea sp. YU22]|uniref:phage head closure protein n=1 Tax=Pantoea sp. YU22 TaxID=2497684 RepID=UPI000F8655C4|nr:phage head closure protein [Pantoea sp. YU22]RTY53643.1 head-tail adaptor protein [Pantoea sp. YU22]
MKRSPALTSARYSFPDPGELNRRAFFRNRVDMPASNFGTEPKDLAEFMAWAKVAQVGATTYQASVQTEKTITHYVTIRYRKGLSVDWELVVDGEILEVRRMRDLNSKRRFWLLECESVGFDRSAGGDVYG